ncbi:hypothetical protein Bbelb_055160 [Branchiostoma belcheri]|nr:hypothetical protein Bbelb_055160 [Branchiostoma belcheri]
MSTKFCSFTVASVARRLERTRNREVPDLILIVARRCALGKGTLHDFPTCTVDLVSSLSPVGRVFFGAPGALYRLNKLGSPVGFTNFYRRNTPTGRGVELDVCEFDSRTESSKRLKVCESYTHTSIQVDQPLL